MKRSWYVFCLLAVLVAFMAAPVTADDGTGPLSTADNPGSTDPTVRTGNLTVRADSKDVGESVVIVGGGYDAFEQVSMDLRRLDESASPADQYASWTVYTDATGSFSTTWEVASEAQAGQPIVVTATGTESGVMGSATSTEVGSRITIVEAPDSIVVGEPFDVTILLEQNCCDGNFAPMPGRQVKFYAHLDACGVNPDDIPLATATTDGDGYASVSLTLADENYYTIGVKYEGEDQPGPDDPANSACDPDGRVAILAAIDCVHIQAIPLPPEISCVSEDLFACAEQTYCYTTTIIESGAGDLVFSIEETPVATIDPATGELCMTPTEGGHYDIQITATDILGRSDTCTAAFEVTMNTAPTVAAGPDTTLHLCAPSEICISVEVDDIDGNLSEITTTHGVYADGQVCFTPYTQGTYEIEITAVDECGESASDIVEVMVTTEQDLDIVCPGDTTVFACDVDTFCFPIEGIPAGAGVSVSGLNASWNDDDQTVCFFAACTQTNTIGITVTTDCGTYDCSFQVRVECNRDPQVVLPPDDTLWACEPATVCLPAGVGDPDGNLAEVFAEGGVYDPSTGEVCVEVVESGEYVVIVTAVDECGDTDSDTSVIIAHINETPTCELPEGNDITIELCNLQTIEIPVLTNDPTATCFVFDGPGEIMDGMWTYTPSGSESFTVTIRCLNDCGNYCQSEFTVTIHLDQPPEMTCPEPGQAMTVCDLSEICLEGFAAIDDGRYLNVTATVNGASFDIFEAEDGSDFAGSICFTPIEGRNDITLSAIDDCGNQSTCDTWIDVQTNLPPVCEAPEDDTVYLCTPEEVSIPIGAIDPEGDDLIIELVSGPGTISDGQWQYTPAGPETVTVAYRATDPCGETCENTFEITFDVNTPPVAECPANTEMSLCDLSEPVCIEGFGATDIDDNLVSVTVNGQPLTDGTACFDPVEGSNTLTLIATDDCGLADTCVTIVDVSLNSAPVCSGPGDTTIVLCRPETVCLPVEVSDPDGNFKNWEITYGGGEIVDGQWCYTPEASRVEQVTVRAYDSCWAYCEFSFTVTFEINSMPEITDRHTSASLCEPGLLREVSVLAYDADEDPLTYELLSGEGSIGADGLISYTPMSAGVYTFQVAAYDTCGGDTGFVYDTIAFNDPPELIVYDSTISLCDVEEICFPVVATDPDNEPVDVYQQGGPGSFSQLTDTSGQTCFMPDDVDSATYVFTYCAVDECGYAKGGVERPSCPPCEPDTIRITVLINRPPAIDCPEAQTFAICEPAEFCIPISATDPDEGDVLTYEVLSSNAEYSEGQVCFWADGSDQFDIVVAVSDVCGHADTCTIPVTVEGNHAPTLELADDFSIELCEPGEVCFSAVAEDVDGDLEDVIAGFGTYDGSNDEVCFWADTAGVYSISITATDTCGATAHADINVTVGFVAPPVVTVNDLSTALCEAEPICVPVAIEGAYTSVTTSLGAWDGENSRVCFTPEAAGTYELIVEASNQCGSDLDTAMIEVDLNEPPTISEMADTTIFLCAPTEICLPVSIDDPNGNIESITVSHGGVYEEGQVCFTPYSGGVYELTISVTDSCGLTVSATATITVDTEQDLEIVCPNDTTIFACVLDTFCLPIDGVPEGSLVRVQGLNTWWDDTTQSVCFFADCGLTNNISLSIETVCGAVTCQFTVIVECNHPPQVVLPPDVSIDLCEGEDLCFPVGISDPDDNLMDVWVESTDPAYAYYDEETGKVCFWGEVSGLYEIIVYAMDSCGLVDSDTMSVDLWVNLPPRIDYCLDTTIVTCDPTDVCLPVGVWDPDGDETIAQVITSLGSYSLETGEVCFQADTNGTYCIEVIAIDTCGAADTAVACVPVQIEDYVYIDCPSDVMETMPLCEPDTVCVPVDIVGENYTVTTNYGYYEDGQLCFFADTSAIFAIELYVQGPCNSDTCEVLVSVNISPSDLISCPDDQTVVLCEPDTLCLDYDISPHVTGVSVSDPAWLGEGQVCIPILQSGEIEVTMVATSECGDDTCSFTITSEFNTPPVVGLGDDTTLVVCEPEQICLPFTVNDAEDNIVDVVASEGASIVDSTVCFTPPDFGAFAIVVTAIDVCGEADSDTLNVTLEPGGTPFIVCPQSTQFFSLCEPDTVCVVVPISPFNATVTVEPEGVYKWGAGEVCIRADTTGTYTVTVIAEAACGVDTCAFDIDVSMGVTPEISCPGQIDTLLCFEEPQSICYPVSISGAGADISVSPIGSYSDGQICLPIDTAGHYEVEIAAELSCGADTCVTVINVTADAEPQLFLPTADLVFERCPGDSDIICIDGIYADDFEGIESLMQTCGPGTFTLETNDSGVLCLPADIDFGLHEFCFETYDGCHTVSGSFIVEIIEEEDCGVCMYVRLDAGECIPVGVRKKVDLIMETDMYLGGFDILLSFDASVLGFVGATIAGTEIDGWEYFEYRLNQAGCGPNCPSGVVRFVGIADINNGAQHPPPESRNPNGVVVEMEFQVVNDQNIGDQFLPLRFVNYDCGDNAVSDTTGTELYVDLRIYGPEGYLLWDETDDVNFPESSRPYGMGTPDECFGGGKVDPIRCIEFYNDGICILHPDSIDARGDVNLNGVAYEIADAVVFSNYFIYGLGVFTVNLAGQIAATDVNADGSTLTVADLVLLIRVIVGDAVPVPKVTPHEQALVVEAADQGPTLAVSAESSHDIGAALLVFDMSGDVSINGLRLAGDAAGMELLWGIQDGQLRALVWDLGTEHMFAGRNNLIEVDYEGGQLNLVEAQAADYQGRPYNCVFKGGSTVPDEFSLGQNYPNPFNPTTTIEFALPNAGEWHLSIFNIQGNLVNQFNGKASAGTHQVIWDGCSSSGASVASGVYFYRLDADDFSATKKMVLLK